MAPTPAESARKLRQRAEEKFRASAPLRETKASEETQRFMQELQIHQIELEMQNEELRHTQIELEVLKDRYFDLYDLAPVGYLTLNENWIILEANVTAATMFGVVKSAFLKKPFSQFIFHEDQDLNYLQFKKISEPNEIQIWEMRLIRADGSQFWAQIHCSYAQNGSFNVTISDTTTLKCAEREAQQSKASAESANLANTAKSQFLANMSHEIRTPLNGIMVAAQLLEKTVLSDEQRQYVNLLMVSGRNLVQQISDILDLSKIEAHKLELQTRDFNLQEETTGIFNLLTNLAREKELELILRIDPDVPLALRGDAVRLRQIIMNLVSNAIKYTAKGFVSLQISMDAEDEQHTTFRIVVRDSGIGIAKDNLESIFERFTQADSSFTRKYGGTGLGLAIVRNLAELMKGRIDVESVEGEGSTFWVTVKLEKQAKDRDMPCPDKNQNTYSIIDSSIRILLVDDNPSNQFGLSRLLQFSGYQVEVANNGSEAINLLEEKDYDLVLMDCSMPVMDGYESTTAIRTKTSNVKNHSIPVIALTACAMQEDREKCFAVGMDDYLSKPVEAPALLAMIEKWAKAKVL
jgi:PAS domain S-box-containing protein